MSEPTFQDLLNDYSEDLFVGRADELTLFERMITLARPPCLILAVSGQGGVGREPGWSDGDVLSANLGDKKSDEGLLTRSNLIAGTYKHNPTRPRLQQALATIALQTMI